MASCRIGHVYIVFTPLTKPPKQKYALCLSAERDQLLCEAGCHELIEHDSYLDLSRMVTHSQAEIDVGKEFACISTALRDKIVAFARVGSEGDAERAMRGLASRATDNRLMASKSQPRYNYRFISIV